LPPPPAQRVATFRVGTRFVDLRFRPRCRTQSPRQAACASTLHGIISDNGVRSASPQSAFDPKVATALRRRWRQIQERVPLVETPTGLKLPRLALPQTDDPGEIARFLFGEGLPASFRS